MFQPGSTHAVIQHQFQQLEVFILAVTSVAICKMMQTCNELAQWMNTIFPVQSFLNEWVTPLNPLKTFIEIFSLLHALPGHNPPQGSFSSLSTSLSFNSTIVAATAPATEALR